MVFLFVPIFYVFDVYYWHFFGDTWSLLYVIVIGLVILFVWSFLLYTIIVNFSFYFFHHDLLHMGCPSQNNVFYFCLPQKA